MAFVDFTGFIACSAILLTFCMRDMRSLRVTAILGNIAFIVYSVQSDLLPPLLLHMVLLPINVRELLRLILAKPASAQAN